MHSDTKSSLESFVCPRCKGELAIDTRGVRCDVCRLLYPMVDGIPVLLIDEARPLPADEEIGLNSG